MSPEDQVLRAIADQVGGRNHASTSGFPSSAGLLSIKQVEERTGMKSSNIYRLIALQRFPAPIHCGGAKWIAAEVDEYIQRRKEERDRKAGANKFGPRPSILAAQANGAGNESISDRQPATSIVRLLAPEFCQALRMLKVDIPELYLDPAVWNITLAVLKVELLQPAQNAPKGKKRQRAAVARVPSTS